MRGGIRSGLGYTLVEILLVLVLVALFAAAALPVNPAQNPQRLDLAAREMALALRFARSEALRTGTPHGVRVGTDQDRAQVFWLDLGTSPPTETYTVLHPLDKKLYDQRLSDVGFKRGVTAAADFRYSTTGPAVLAVAFDARGEPRSPVDLKALVSGAITLSAAGAARTIAVAPVTGRVTLQ